MNKKLLKLVMYNYFTFCTYLFLMFIPVLSKHLFDTAVEVISELLKEIPPSKFKLEKQHMINQGQL